MKKITLFIILLISANLFSQTPDTPCTATVVSVNSSGNCNNIIYTFDDTETDSSGFNAPDCAANSTIEDRWYTFQMPSNGNAVKIVTSDEGGFSSSFYDPAIEVFAATNSSDPCNSLVSIGCDNDGNPDNTSSVFFPQIIVAQPADTYIYFRIWHDDGDFIGDFNMCLFEIAPPLVASNDECSTPDLLTLTNDCSSPVLKTFFQATPSSDGTISCATNEGGDVWFEIQVDNDQLYDITIETSEDSGSNVFDTAMTVYSGTCNALSEVACDTDSGTNLFSRITISDQQGVTLYVRVFPEDIGQSETFYICATKTATLGVDKTAINAFAMYPNPAKDLVHLIFNQLSSNKVDITIYDIQGKLVKLVTKNIHNQGIPLDISDLHTGMYFLKVFDGTKELTKKLVVR